MMNPEGEPIVDERREAEIRAIQSNVRAGIDTERAVPSKVIYFEVRNNQVVAIDPETGKDL